MQNTPSNSTQPDILINTLTTASAGRVFKEMVLNRTKTLNALTHDMCVQIHENLTAWADDDTVLAVIVRSNSERAFCAGGDIRSIYYLGQEDLAAAQQFFSDEYAMNRALYHFPKPYISLLDGITMGGGAGISIHGSHRIATENTLFAMPESKIGFFPDVGMSYHLARMPNHWGRYLGLTGLTIGPAECCYLGLAHGMIARSQLSAFVQTLLAKTDLDHENCHAEVSALIESFAQSYTSSDLMAHEADIERCFAYDRVAEVMSALANCQREWAKVAFVQMQKNSPHSMKWALTVLKDSETLSLDEVIARDEALSHVFLSAPDLYEGVRALLIDKDFKPNWQVI